MKTNTRYLRSIFFSFKIEDTVSISILHRSFKITSLHGLLAIGNNLQYQSSILFNSYYLMLLLIFVNVPFFRTTLKTFTVATCTHYMSSTLYNLLTKSKFHFRIVFVHEIRWFSVQSYKCQTENISYMYILKTLYSSKKEIVYSLFLLLEITRWHTI